MLPVAIKVLHGDFGGSSESQLESFLKEARIMTALDHPRVIKCYSMASLHRFIGREA